MTAAAVCCGGIDGGRMLNVGAARCAASGGWSSIPRAGIRARARHALAASFVIDVAAQLWLWLWF